MRMHYCVFNELAGPEAENHRSFLSLIGLEGLELFFGRLKFPRVSPSSYSVSYKFLQNCSLLIAMSSMITTAAWVPRGFASPFPQKYNFDEEEFERIASLAKLNLDDANEDLEEAQAKDGEGSSDKEESKKPAEEGNNEYVGSFRPRNNVALTVQ